MTDASPHIKRVEFLKSVYSLKDLPGDDLPEIAFAGRSNVGKSSLLNAVMGRKRLVRVSSRPGFTQCLNFFLVNDSAYFVDLPGYGYAKAPRKTVQKWQALVESYLKSRRTLAGVVCIFDIRRHLDDLDLNLLDYLISLKIKSWIVFNKADKLSRNKIEARLKQFRILLPKPASGLWVVSARTGRGIGRFLESVILPEIEGP